MAGEAKLGAGVPDGADRDAVHVAVIPCIATRGLQPGQHVGVGGGHAHARTEEKIGIVDPFLTGPIEEGSRIYVCLYPGSITSMRHHWRHPAIDPPVTDAEQWLRDYAFAHNHYDTPHVGFQNLIDGLKTGDLFFHGDDLHSLDELPDADELKRHAEEYLGIKIDWDKFTFRCSC